MVFNRPYIIRAPNALAFNQRLGGLLEQPHRARITLKWHHTLSTLPRFPLTGFQTLNCTDVYSMCFQPSCHRSSRRTRVAFGHFITAVARYLSDQREPGKRHKGPQPDINRPSGNIMTATGKANWWRLSTCGVITFNGNCKLLVVFQGFGEELCSAAGWSHVGNFGLIQVRFNLVQVGPNLAEGRVRYHSSRVRLDSGRLELYLPRLGHHLCDLMQVGSDIIQLGLGLIQVGWNFIYIIHTG